MKQRRPASRKPGPPSLSREEIMVLAACPECGRPKGSPCFNKKRRNHHGRMVAAQVAWAENPPKRPVARRPIDPLFEDERDWPEMAEGKG